MAELIIDPEQINEAFLKVLYTESEIKGYADSELGTEGQPKGTVVVEGIMNRFGFHPERLEQKREQVRHWLRALPHQFHADGGEEGGGWSFLNACNQENGVQWTGLHLRMEQLFCLGMGLGFVKSLLPRRMWANLPGGMPYYVIDLDSVVQHDATRA